MSPEAKKSAKKWFSTRRRGASYVFVYSRRKNRGWTEKKGKLALIRKQDRERKVRNDRKRKERRRAEITSKAEKKRSSEMRSQAKNSKMKDQR